MFRNSPIDDCIVQMHLADVRPMYKQVEVSRVQIEHSSLAHKTPYGPPMGPNVTFPSLPMLTVLILGALIVTGIVALSWLVALVGFPWESVTTGCTTPGCASANSFTS